MNYASICNKVVSLEKSFLVLFVVCIKSELASTCVFCLCRYFFSLPFEHIGIRINYALACPNTCRLWCKCLDCAPFENCIHYTSRIEIMHP